MPVPYISTLPPAPSRNDPPDVFSNKADLFVASLPPFGVELNTALDWVNDTSILVDADRVAAGVSEVNAATSASNASMSETNAATSASNAATSASNAGVSAGLSASWAEGVGDLGGGTYSAKHWATAAESVIISSIIDDASTATNRTWSASKLNTDLNGYALKTVSMSAGTGLSGGGTLAANRTFNVTYGTAANTAAQGNDSRITNGQTAFSWGNHNSVGYALDNAVVKLSGAQNITGLKTPIVGTGIVRLDGVYVGPLSFPQSAYWKFTESSQLNTPPGTGTWRHVLTIQGWTAYSSSYPSYQMSFGEGAVGLRQATSATVWGPWRTICEKSAAGGIDFGSVVGASVTDLSKHIDLYGTTYGFNVTGGTLNVVSSGGGGAVVARASGGFTCTGNVSAYSDIRLKTDIQTLDGSKVYDMRGVSFTKDDKEGSGVIAQELQKVAPELVNDGDEYLSVAYGNIVGYLIEAIKLQKSEIDQLRERLDGITK